MQCMVTWTEGEEVFYRFLTKEEVECLLEEDKNYIVTWLPN